MKTTKLEKLNACSEAVKWVASQKDYKTAWQNCERGDWMLWLAWMLKVDDRKLTLTNFKCANQVRHLMKDKRSIVALDAKERYGKGEISRDELNAYVISAADAATDADAVSAYATYDDAARAAYAVSTVSVSAASVYAAYASAVSISAAYTAYATYANARADAIKESLKKSADFCREILTDEVLTAYKKLR